MSNIFKIYINNYDYKNNENILTHMYLFIKNKYYQNKDLESIDILNSVCNNSEDFLKSGYIEKYFKDDFSDLDKMYLKKYSLNIFFIDENIYNDDTIETIKLKFLKNYNFINSKNEICYEEIYMFGLINKTYNPLEIYNNLSNYGKISLKRELMLNYFNNINEKDILIPLFKNKENYEFDDFNKLNIEELNIQIPLGHLIYNLYNINYTTNPYNAKKYNSILKTQTSNSIEINNNNILFENNLLDNNLYISLFEDVINYNRKILYDDLENAIKIYFPLISNKDINSYDIFLSKKKELIKKSKDFVNNENFINKYKFIDTIYNIYYNSESFNTKLNGIYGINFNMYSNINLNLSIETLFKLFNSSSNIPFIKFNPGKKIENMYRLYCNKISKNNKKIPLLKKENISNYAKTIGKINTLSMAIIDDNIKFKKIKNFLIEINSSGIININIIFKSQSNKQELEEIVKYYLNDNILMKIEELNNYDNIIKFETFDSTNIEILNINYNIYYKLVNNCNDINKIKKCLTYLFNTENSKNTNYIKFYKYKRISYYDDSNEINDFIIENIKLSVKPTKIIELLKENFGIKSEDECKQLFEDTLNNLNSSKNLNNNSQLKIKNNTGFKTKIEINNNNISVNINNINNINYIAYINLFFDGLLKILNNNTENFIDSKIDLSICNSFRGRKKTSNDDYFYKDQDSNDIKKIENKEIYNKDLNIEQIEDYDNISDLLSLNDSDEENDLLDILLDNNDEDNNELEDDSKKSDNTSDLLKDEVILDDDINLDDLREESEAQQTESEKSETDKSEAEESEAEESEAEESEVQESKHKENEVKQSKDLKKEVPSKNIQDSSITNNFDNSYYKLRLEKYQPQLFKNKEINYKTKKSVNVSKTDGQFVKYSRLCQSPHQPIILTEEELQNIELNNPNSYDKKSLLKYSVDEDKNYYYMCPKFWDMKNNIPLTKDQANSGNFGTIFNREKNKSGNILERLPEVKSTIEFEPKFLANSIETKELKDFCLPCCYKKSKKEDSEIEKRKNECLHKYKKIKLKQQDISDPNKENSSSDDSDDDHESNKNIQNNLKKIYISKHDKNILSKDKVGDLPIIISRFLQFNSNNCKIPGESMLKDNYSCLLRYGVESSNIQSFIACISDAYCKYKKLKTTYSIKDFKKIIINSLTIDNFIKYNNGNLTHIFLSKNINNKILDEFTIHDEYKTSEFYKYIDNENINQINLYKKIIISYNNFKNYLKSTTHVIDYTYLWDIICKPNPDLFENGINLLIFDITNEDITENVKVICPHQNYSTEYIDNNKDNLLLLKNNDYYEPIYLIKDSKKNRVIPLISFQIDSNELNLVEFKRIINIIKDHLNEKCIANIDKTQVDYEFENNLDLHSIINIILNLDYNINHQLVNYEAKTIGIFISKKTDINRDDDIKEYLIPCYPSNIHDKYNIKFFDDDSISYNNYKDTKLFLYKIYQDSEEKIKIKPKYKIIKEELIVGILTNGDQLIIIDPPEMYIDDELESINDENHLINNTIDVKVQTVYKEDKERLNLVNSIKLENAFYKNFKNILKKLLVYPIYINNKKTILNIIKNNSLLYLEKLRQIINELKIIGENNIIFSDFDTEIIGNIKKISSFMNHCDDEFCIFDKTKKIPNITIPSINLITGDKNENIYYLKSADEFIRFNFDKIFLYDINKNYNNQNIKYEINDDEIIILQSSINSLLLNEKISIKNNFENYTNFDTFYSINNELLDPINTKDYKIEKKRLKVESFGQPIGEKMKISIPKLKMESIKKLKTIKEESNISKKTESNKDELTEKRELIKDESEIEEDKDDTTETTEEEKILFNLENFEDNSESCIIKKSKPFNINQKSIINYFNKELFETYYTFSNINDLKCSYQLIITLIKYYYQVILKTTKFNDLTIDKIKNELLEIYTSDQYGISFILNRFDYDKIPVRPYISILKSKIKNITKEKDSINETIKLILTNENYYLTYIDLYLISKKYDIPIIFINQTIVNIESIESKDKIRKHLIANTNKNNNYYFFIKLPSINVRENIKYHKLLHTKDNLLINIDNDISDEYRSIILQDIENYNSDKDYILIDSIKTFNKLTKKTSKQSKTI